MLTSLKKWFQPPIFPEDVDKTRSALLLNVVLQTFLFALPILIVGVLLGGPFPRFERTLFFLGCAWLTIFGTRLLMFAGQVKAAGKATVIIIWVTTTLSIYNLGTVRAPATAFYLLTIVISGLIISRRTIIWMTGINSLTIILLIVAENNGYLPTPTLRVTITQGITFIVAFAIVSILLFLAVKSIDEALAGVRNELTKRNKTETRLRTLVENSPDLILEINRQGEILFISRHPEYISRNIREFVSSVDLVTVMDIMEKAFTSGEPQTFELKTANLAGQSTWDSIRIGPVKQGDQVTSLTVIMTDIMIQKHVEQEREKLLKETEAQNAELERFNYTISHELKSPVVTIKGFLGMLKKDMEENRRDRIQKDFERISEATEKMGMLLSELIELSKIGRVVNLPTQIDLTKLVQEALEMLNDRLRSSSVTVKVAPDLPSVYGDEIRLREVFENLIDNAVKYMGDQPFPLIEIGKRENETETIFYVKDNGIGIDSEYHTQIFGLFDKLNAATEGTGIGLALIKRIIEIHGGRIWVESEGLGKGATFCLTIPVRNQDNSTIIP